VNGDQTIDVQLALIAQKVDQIDQKLDDSLIDHEERLRRTERWMYALPASLITALISIVVALYSAQLER